ncbi:MAG: sel1 repeat family protein [Methylococcales bacterium]|nr:sel1 repeat family protein [Methylococcales bacterium]
MEDDFEAELNQLETEFYQSVTKKKLIDIKSYLEQIEVVLPAQSIRPIVQFRLLVKASGSDLPCDGSWFKIHVVDQNLPNAIIISQPQGESIGFGMTGEWHVELQAPIDVGDYCLKIAMESVETDQADVEIPFTVELNSKRELSQPFKEKLLFFVALLGFVIGISWLEFSTEMKTAYKNWTKDISAKFTDTAKIKNSEESANKQRLDSKTKAYIDKMLEQSFTNLSVAKRQKAWQKLSLFVNLQTDVNNSFVREIQKKRAQHKHQMEKWLLTNKNSEESIKRIQVLAFVDDDKNAQRRLGDYYASGKNVVKNLGKAWQWYQRASNKGDIEAQKLLAGLEAKADQLLTSLELVERIQGYEITEATASAGGINAQLWMGYRYESGDGIPRNLYVAADWYRKAAEQGNSFASEKLGKIVDLIEKQKKKF